VWVDPDAADGQAELVDVFRREYGATLKTGWGVIASDNPVFVKYAGLDVLLTRRLFDVLAPMVRELSLDNLSQFEHHLQSILAVTQRRGMRVDVDYALSLSESLLLESESYRLRAATLGVDNVNATSQVSAGLLAMGEELTDRTASGQVKVDKQVLLPLADLDMQWNRLGLREPNPLANAVLRAKRAEKWRESYARPFLDLRDSSDRLHPWISSLQARTARMSVSRPPLQQLPSGDFTVRRALLAEPGHVVSSIDYSQVEVRVAAALSQDPVLIDALTSGEDLHSTTARHIFGDGFTYKERKVVKMVTFARLYGSGASNIARQAGVDVSTAKRAVSGFDRAYRTLARYGKGLQSAADYGRLEVVTPSGRHLPLDRDRTYAALNAMVQSTARDVLAQAIVDLHGRGFGDALMLPIHDELLFSFPAADAEAMSAEVASVMSRDFFGVNLPVDVEVGGNTWGSLYE
jgi:DNA polymerase-1